MGKKEFILLLRNILSRCAVDFNRDVEIVKYTCTLNLQIPVDSCKFYIVYFYAFGYNKKCIFKGRRQVQCLEKTKRGVLLQRKRTLLS